MHFPRNWDFEKNVSNPNADRAVGRSEVFLLVKIDDERRAREEGGKARGQGGILV